MVPTNVTQRYDNDQMTVTWQDSATDVDYEVQVLLGDGLVPLDPQPAIEYSGKTAIINAKAVGEGQTYSARVRAVKAEYCNVLKNGDASQGLNDWEILENGGDQWAVEDGPAASCPGKPVRYNFVTSYEWDVKAQTIDLIAEGFNPDFLDERPGIQISEWICSRSDCQGQYRLVVELRDENQKAIERFDTGVIVAPTPEWVYPWKEIAHRFSNYQSGLRYIYFEHSGKDVNWWSGHYAVKMTGAEVRIETMINGDRTVGEWSTASNPITTRV
jgi:hypothetical protein